MLLVDAANVVGSRPTGWWHDRAAAATRLIDSVRTAIDAGQLLQPVVIVLEGAARGGASEGRDDGVEIVHAPGEGDDTLAALVTGAAEPVVVVTADRALRDRVRRAGAEVVGPTWLLDRLDP